MTDLNWPPPPPPEYQSATRTTPSHEAYAGWGSRAGALIIDSVVSIAVIAIGSASNSVALVLIGFVIAVLYPVLTMMRPGERNGQTWGKQAAGIRVVRDNRQPIGFGYALLREILAKGVLGILTIPLLISYLWPLWDQYNQALHDKMVSTYVVEA